MKIIGSLVYRTRQYLRMNKEFMEGLKRCPFHDTFFKDVEQKDFNLWHLAGTPEEISQYFINLGKSAQGRKDKVPALFNFQPVKQDVGLLNTTYTFNLAFVAPTNNEWSTGQREKLVFEPLLRPMYEAFLRQVRESGYFEMDSVNNRFNIEHAMYEVYTTGSEMDKMIQARYSEYLDAIQVNSLRLTLRRECLLNEKKIITENELVYTSKN